MNASYIDDPLRETTLQRLEKDYFFQESLSCKKYDNGIVLPYKGSYQGKTAGGVIDATGVFVDDSGLHENHSCGYPFLQEDVVSSEEEVIYIGMLFPIWGHCLTDCLKKLWFLYTEDGKSLLERGCKVVAVVMMEDKLSFSRSFRDLLSALKVNLDDITIVHSPTQYRTIYVPDDALQRKDDDIYYTTAFVQLRDRIIEGEPKKNCRVFDKIYFSRSQFQKGKQDIGEKQIERVFRYLGYKIIYPEKLSFAEQVALLQHCTHFAATEGSISHNAMFCRRGTKVCIVRKAAYLNNYQFMINHLAGLEVTYVDAHLSVLVDNERVWNGPFFLYANRNLLRFAGLPISLNGFSIRLFRQYMRQAYAKNKDRIAFSDYYVKRLLDELSVSYFENGVLKRLLRNLFRKIGLTTGAVICKLLHKS